MRKIFEEPEDIKVLIEAAEKGNIKAQYELGKYYYKKHSLVGIDYLKKGIYWYTKAAEGNYPEAQYDLAIFHIQGFGFEINYKKTFYWLERAAKLNHLEAQCELAFSYKVGRGVKQNFRKAYEWYRKAAKQGYSEGLLCLSTLYANGEGVSQDYDKAYLLCKMYAEKTNTKPFYLKEYYKKSSFSKKVTKKNKKS